MPAFDPVRDAVLNSPVDPSSSYRFDFTPPTRRATHLSVLLNSDQPTEHHPRPNTLSHLLLNTDLYSGTNQPNSPIPDSPPSRPSSSQRTTSSPAMPPPPSPTPPTTTPYNPIRRTAPGSILIPLSQAEINDFKHYRGQGSTRLAKRKRAASDEPDGLDQPPVKKLVGDVGVVVQHCTPFIYLFTFTHLRHLRQLTARRRCRPTIRVTHHWPEKL